jgi:hypothetical protein
VVVVVVGSGGKAWDGMGYLWKFWVEICVTRKEYQNGAYGFPFLVGSERCGRH